MEEQKPTEAPAAPVESAPAEETAKTPFLAGKKTYITLAVMWLTAVLGPHLKSVAPADQQTLFTESLSALCDLVTYLGPIAAAYFRAKAQPKPPVK